MSWNTKLKDLCRVPIIGAPMSGHSGGKLAAAVSNAGGIGFIGGGHCLFSDDGLSQLEHEIEIYRMETTEPLYVGFVGHSSLQDAVSMQRYERFLETHTPKIVQFFAPAIRNNNVRLTQEYNSLFWAQVGSFSDAQQAINAGADALILQGSEAGGHGLRQEVGNAAMPLTNAVLYKLSPNIPVISAGGVVDAKSMASYMMLGCDGVVLGTRLWASQEALGGGKHELVQQNTCDTVVRTTVFDAIQNKYSPTPWPEPYDSVGALRNQTYERFRDTEFDEDDVDFYRQNINDPNIGLIHAGEGVASIESILPASEIVVSINEGARDWVKSASQRLLE